MNSVPNLEDQVVSIVRDEAGIMEPREYTRGELRRAFDKVADPQNWKLPIDTHVLIYDADEVEAIAEAVRFFAGCDATFKQVSDPDEPEDFVVMRVTAPGYYAAVGA